MCSHINTTTNVRLSERIENIYLFDWYFTLSHNTYCENCQIKGSLNRESICLNSRANVAYIYDGSHQYSANSLHIHFAVGDRAQTQHNPKDMLFKRKLNKSNFSYKL